MCGEGEEGTRDETVQSGMRCDPGRQTQAGDRLPDEHERRRTLKNSTILSRTLRKTGWPARPPIVHWHTWNLRAYLMGTGVAKR